MVQINFCPSCGAELTKESFICPECCIDVKELFAKGYLLMGEEKNNKIELLEDDQFLEPVIELAEDDLLNNQDINVKPGDEIVIVVPESDGDEIVIDLDELGIDVESLGDDVNIVIEVEGEEDGDEILLDDDDFIQEPNEWFFDDDPYGIVYYEFVNDDEE